MLHNIALFFRGNLSRVNDVESGSGRDFLIICLKKIQI